jgi:two-component SAPR family response regulator
VRALLAFLALQRGRPVHHDLLIESMWPELNYAAALHNLNTIVYNLRRSLEPTLEHGAESSYIRCEGDCYFLDHSPAHWLDVKAFEAGMAQARREPDPIRAMRQYREVLTLYQGDFLADLNHTLLWTSQERVRLRELYLNGLEELGELCERQHEERHAAELCLKALAVDPCRETACQQLMRLAIRRGDRAAAVTYYLILAEALRRELGLTPSEETQLIFETAIGSG